MAIKPRSLSNVFSQSPMQEALTTKPKTQKTTSPLKGFEGMAKQTGVPVNILMAEAERAGTDDPRMIATRAAAWQSRLTSGAQVPDIAAELVPEDTTTFLNRAIEIDRATYGSEIEVPDAAPATPAKGEAGGIENTARTVGGAMTRFGASTLKGIGIATDTVADVATLGQSRRDIDQFRRDAGLRDKDAPGPQRGDFFTDAMDIAAEPLRDAADGIEAGRSSDLNEAIAATSLEGELFDPRTWEVSEDATLRGFAHKGLAVLGDLLPIVGAAVVTRSPAVGGVLGGLSAGGAAGQDARDRVYAAAEERDESGVSALEKSDKFQELVERGLSTDEATEQLAVNAERWAGQVAGVIGGAGGVATTKIMAPLEGKALTNSVAGRVGLAAVEEGGQEVAEGVGQRMATNAATGLEDNVMDGTLEEFALGGVAGGALGGASTAFDRATPPAEPTPPALPAPDLVTPPPSAYGPDGNLLPENTAPPARPKGRLEAMMDATMPPMAMPAPTLPTPAETPAPAANPAPQDLMDDGAVLEDLPPRDFVGERQAAQARLAQLDANDRRNGATTESLEARNKVRAELAELPVDTVPMGTFDAGTDPDSGKIITATVADAGPFDYETTYPSPDIDLYTAAARAGMILPTTPQETAMFVERGLGALTDAVLDQRAAKAGSPKAKRAQKAIDGIVADLAAIYKPEDVADMQAAVTGYADSIEASAQPAPADVPATDAPAETPAPSEADLRAQIAAATNAALDEADAAEDAAKPSKPMPATAMPPSSVTNSVKMLADANFFPKDGSPNTYERTVGGKGQRIERVKDGWRLMEDGKVIAKAKGEDGILSLSNFLQEPDAAMPPTAMPPATLPAAKPDAKPAPMPATSMPPPTVQPDAKPKEDINDLMADARKRRADRTAQVADLSKTDDPVRMTNKAGDLAVLVSPAADRPGKWRATYMGADKKPSGHVDAETKAEALERAFEDGFTVADQSTTKPQDDATTDKAAMPATAMPPPTVNAPDPNPTDGQKEAGNYRKKHVRWNGLDISIETAKGQERTGTGPDGTRWAVTMPADYGDIKGTTGADGDPLDIYMGELEGSDTVVIVNQVDERTGAFDEHKIIVGTGSTAAALRMYEEGFSDGKGKSRIGSYSTTSQAGLKAWIETADHTKPTEPVKAKPKADETAKPQDDATTDDADADGSDDTAAPKGDKIEDFGEKIGGARKDKARRMAEDLATDIDAASMTMTEAFPVPDYEALAASGVPHNSLAMIAALRAAIPRKTRRNRRGWATDVEASRKIVAAIVAGELEGDTVSAQANAQVSNSGGWSGLGEGTIEAFQKLPTSMLHEASTLAVVRATFGRSDDGKTNTIVSYTVGPLSKWSGLRVTTTDDAAKELMRLVARARDDRASKAGTGGRKPVKLGVYKRTSDETWFVGFKVSDVLPLSPNFESAAAARTYMNDNTEALQKAADDLRDGPRERTDRNRKRKGPAHREGDVTPEMFTDAFGFRGVEFGNWNNAKDRQNSLNDAYDALTDLAGLLDLPTKAMSLDGTLGLAFGARGTGGKNPAAAHYEPDKIVINLTKRSGAGSLAHEWFHAIDHHLARIDAAEGGSSAALTGATARNRSEYMSDRRSSGAGRTKDAAEAFNALRKALTADHPWFKRSKEADKGRSKPYFATTIELAARSFEKYVIDRLTTRDMVNDYLANIDGMSGAYPSTREMANTDIRTAWDAALASITTTLDAGTDNVPTLPNADTSRLYEGPEAGEIWESPEGRKKIESRDGDTFYINSPDGSTEVMSGAEVDEQIAADRAALEAATQAKKEARTEAYQDQTARNTEWEDRARTEIAKFEADAKRKPGAVQSKLFGKTYNFRDYGMLSRGGMMIARLDEGWRVSEGGDRRLSRNLRGPKGEVYSADTWTKGGLDFAEWYGNILDARAKSKVAPAKPKAKAKTEDELRAEINAATVAALDEADAAEGQGTDTTKPQDQQATGPRTAGQAAASAAGNLGTAADEAMTALRKLFGDPNTLNMGPAFSRDTYRNAKPHFDAVVRSLGAAKTDLADLARALVRFLSKQDMDKDARRAMQPYLEEYLFEVQSKAHDPFNPQEEAADAASTDDTPKGDAPDTETQEPSEVPVSPEQPVEPPVADGGMQPVTDAALARFREGDGFANIVQARKLAGETLDRPITEADYKAVEEAIEEAIVVRARELIAEGRDPQATYQSLVDLYAMQPLLAQRTSNSMELQAYSTPAPLAYLASQLAGVTNENTVLEPTAGMGMLTIGADASKVIANELDPERAATISRTTPGATVTALDATKATFAPADVVIANPPFGGVFVDGKRQQWPMGQTKTREVDHAIAWRALDAMPDNGTAVLILGGVKKQLTGDDRVKAYRSAAKGSFYANLYDAYNVVDHFTVDGDLYKRQGAGWPVDVIVIRGRGKSLNPLPQKEAPPILNTWGELEGKLDLADSLGTAEVTADRTGSGQPTGNGGAQADPAGVRGSNADQNGGVDTTRRPSGTDTDAGTRTGNPSAEQQRPANAGDVDTGSDGRTGRAGAEPDSVPGNADQSGSQRGNGSSDAGANAGRPADSTRSVAKRAANTEAESAFQVQYEPRSKATFAVGTLVPVKMQDAMKKALDSIEKRNGDIDAFVAKSLDYDLDAMLGTDTKPGYFSAEQVDALAMAIDNVGQGKGFIIGDQTGVGKGRFVAAMLRFAEKQGITPIFVTKDPGLFGDMVRDLRDIGEDQASSGIFPTNTTLRGSGALPLSDNAGDTLESRKPAEHKKAVAEMLASGQLVEGDRYLFTTYSQLQAVKGKEPERRPLLRALAGNAMFLLDESHEAGGQADTGWKDPEAVADRATFMREVLAMAKGAVFSSATYAKNPTVMSLYAKTDLSLAVEDISELGAAIALGGVPLQQAIANMLVEAGQYARRERSFEGVSMALTPLDINMTVATDTIARVADIFDADMLVMQAARKDAIENLKADGHAETKDGAVGVESGDSTNFAAVIHNVVNQMLLALKVDAVADRAIQAWKDGEKPIMAVYNTNGALLDAMIEGEGLSVGDKVDLPFKVILHNYIERLRRITVKDGKNGEAIRIDLTDAQLGSRAATMLKKLHEDVDNTDFGKLSASPLDLLHDKMRAAGMKTGEITGRSRVIEDGILTARDASSAAKKRTMAAYNKGGAGGYDALIINQSGSTGFSLHATALKGNDGKQRLMIVMQADPNIDVFMQMLGRIHRTGQILLPKYEIAVTPLAAEKRGSAILMRKMASLNANTTASKDSAVTLDNVTDFLNEVGDKVMRRYLAENFDLAVRLDLDLDKENIAQKATGRMSILPPVDAERIYSEIEELYAAEIDELNRLGENPLEAQVYDWQAKEISSAVIEAGKGSSSPFDADTVMKYLSVRRLTKPYSWDEVQDRLAEAQDGITGESRVEAAAAHVGEVGTAYMHTLQDKVDALRNTWEKTRAEDDKADNTEGSTKTIKAKKAYDAAVKRFDEARTSIENTLSRLSDFEPGTAVMIGTSRGHMYGVILDLDASAMTNNPLALSKVAIRIAVADAARELRVPLSRFTGTDALTIEPAPADMVQFNFDSGQSSAREVRAVATGNLINAFARFGTGRIAFYTDENGATQTGVVMPATFDVRAELEREPVRFKTPEQVTAFLNGGDRIVDTGDGALTIKRTGYENYELTASTRAKVYYVGKAVTDITGQWTKRGSAPAKITVTSAADLNKLLAVYTDMIQPHFVTHSYKGEAREITGDALPDIKAPAGAAEKRAQPRNLRKRRDNLRRSLFMRLADTGMADEVSLQLARKIVSRTGTPLEGFQKGSVIAVAMDSANPESALDHEIVHAMRDSKLWGREGGLFGTADWRALVKQVRRQPQRLKAMQDLYPDLDSAAQMEEAVAELYADYRAGRDVDTAQGIMGRVQAMLETIGQVLRREGYRSGKEVMAAMANGTLAARARADLTTPPDGGSTPPEGAKERRKKSAGTATAESKAASIVNRAIDASMELAEKAKDAATKQSARALLSNMMDHGQTGTSILALVPGRPLLTELARNLPSARIYLLAKEAMDATRQHWAVDTDTVAKKWQWQAVRNKTANDQFMSLMHDATLAGIDPAEGGMDPATLERLVKEETGADPKADPAIVRAKIKGNFTDFVARYHDLPKPFQDLWAEVRDMYGRLADEWDKAIIDNHEHAVERAIHKMREENEREQVIVEAGTLSKKDKAKAIERLRNEIADAEKRARESGKRRMGELRAAFESNRTSKPYFPLARFGNYYVTLKDEAGKVVSFSKFKGQKEQERFAAEHEGKFEVITGVMQQDGNRLDKSVDAGFVAEVADILSRDGVDDDVMDAIWQRYLETMPDMSLRKSRIHRKGTEGYTQDALRSFGNHMFHGAHQLARLKHQNDMQDALDDMADQAKASKDPNRAMHVVNEISRRHEFTMSPKNAGWTATASSLAFVWYLGATPAAAMVNLTQTTIIGIPMMRARYKKSSTGDVTRELGSALRDFGQGKGYADKSSKLTAKEREAMDAGYDRGLMDKTQASDIAGIAETGIEYNPIRSQAMAVIGFMYHHAERANREVTFLASYRLGIKEGLPHASAIDRAADATWDIHFDYQNNSRPRFMQDDFPKVLLTFRAFQVNMIYRMVRDTHQSLHGATPELRTEARRQLIGITGQMALHAGITGTWGYGMVMMIVGLFFSAAGADDEPEQALKKLMVGSTDPTTALGHARRFIGSMALYGVPGTLTGTALSDRIGMPNLWFRDPYKDMEGREAYTNYLQQLVGPVPGLAEKGFVGMSQLMDGKVERGIESMVPKFVRDGMRSVRYLSEGVTTYSNEDPVVEHVSPYQALVQALGLTPAQIAERYDTNNAIKRLEGRIEDARSDTLGTIRKAVRDTGALTPDAVDALHRYNAKYPEWIIDRGTIKRSLSGARRASQNNTGGININDKIADRVLGKVAPTVFD